VSHWRAAFATSCAASSPSRTGRVWHPLWRPIAALVTPLLPDAAVRPPFHEGLGRWPGARGGGTPYTSAAWLRPVVNDAGEEVIDLPPAPLGEVPLEFSPERLVLLNLRLPGLLAGEPARQRHIRYLVVEAKRPVDLLGIWPTCQGPVNIMFNELIAWDLCSDPWVDLARRLGEPLRCLSLEGAVSRQIAFLQAPPAAVRLREESSPHSYSLTHEAQTEAERLIDAGA
jgi:hypothetical protein